MGSNNNNNKIEKFSKSMKLMIPFILTHGCAPLDSHIISLTDYSDVIDI